MGLKLYEETSVQAIADAIRAKNGSSDTYTISEMSTAIENIPSGGGDIYKYHWSNDGKICVREGLGEYVWFFVGYVKETTADIEPPEELVDYFPAYCGGDDGRSVIYGQAYATASSTTSDRYIGFYNNKIRTWNSDLSQLISGTFYGVIYITPDTDASSSPQTNEYISPTDVPISDITLIEKTITQNGTYSAEDDGYVGYSDVTVNVPSGAEKTKVVTDDIVLVSQNGSTVDWHEDGSVDFTWLGGTGIGFNYIGIRPIKDAKRILIHMDELGESYQHSYSTEQRNWNFSVGLTNVALPQNYIDLATIESQGKLVTDVEVDVIDNYGKTDLNYIIDLSSYQNQDLYLFILAAGMTIEGLKVTVVYDNVPSRMRDTGYNRLFIETSMSLMFDPNGKFKTIWLSNTAIGCTLQGVRDLNGVITSVHVTGSITDSYEYANKTGFERCQFVVGFTNRKWNDIMLVGYNDNGSAYIKEEITLTNQQEVNNIDIEIDLTDSQYEQYASTPKYFFISLLGISGEFEVTME